MLEQAFQYPGKGHEDYIEAFVNEMNKQALNLKLKKCNFQNPHGLLSKSNHASCADVIVLMNYAMKYDLIAEVCSKNTHKCIVYSWDLNPRQFYWENTNKLINQYFVGSKTGITYTAGPCLVTNFKFGEYISFGVLINSKTPEIRWKEMATIILWHFDKYLSKNKLAGYNYQLVQEFKERQK